MRITFGDLQERVTDYSGTLALTTGRVVEIVPWRFFGDDRMMAWSSPIWAGR